MTKPLISICIITYNHERYIQDCLMSALAQHVDVDGAVEILLGDDASTDGTETKIRAVLAAFPGRINYIRRPANIGGCENLKDLVRLASGKFIAQLDGDDFWLPGKLSSQLAHLSQHPACVACYTNAIVVNEAGGQLGAFCSPIAEPIDLPFLVRRGNFLNHSSMVYRAAYKHLVLDFSDPFIDYQIHLKFAQVGMLGFINAALVVYRMGSTQSIVRSTPDVVLCMYLDGLASALSDPRISTAVRREALQHFWGIIAVECMLKLRLGWARKWAARLRTLHPDGHLRVLIAGSIGALKTIGKLLLRRAMIALFGMTKLRVMHER